jgi:hypothetical protein
VRGSGGARNTVDLHHYDGTGQRERAGEKRDDQKEMLHNEREGEQKTVKQGVQ